MSTLDEIEAAVETLSPEQKQELLLYVSKRLRAPGAVLPQPRLFTSEQVAAWIAEDEEDMRRFNSKP